jgi:ketosteroid isomerase-like protein
MGAAENKATVAAAYEAFGRGDVQAVIDTNADDAVWTINTGPGSPLAGEHKGKDGIGALFGKIGESIEITKFDIAPVAADGDVVVARGYQAYTVKATGKTVEGPLIHFFTFNAAGKCTQFEEFEIGVDDAFLP